MSIQNVFMSRHRENQIIVLMSVFGYGFVALIIAICVAIYLTQYPLVLLLGRESLPC